MDNIITDQGIDTPDKKSPKVYLNKLELVRNGRSACIQNVPFIPHLAIQIALSTVGHIFSLTFGCYSPIISRTTRSLTELIVLVSSLLYSLKCVPFAAQPTCPWSPVTSTSIRA